MPTIYIDNRPYEIEEEGKNLLEVCLLLGFDIPYFCWHPAMHSVGACRLCAIKKFKNAEDVKGEIVMSCMEPASDGVRISIADPEAATFRAQVIEWLMVNHPHDCPICDEGGECHLQDMTVMTGHVYRRYRFRKRTHTNQNLGPFIHHEMNRCIQCFRCVRFYRDFAGGRDFNVFGWHDDVYFGRHEDGALESEFSGNLVEVCPTGVFTDKSLKRHYTRKWDLQTAPSLCIHCGLGCNTIPGERYDMLRRVYARYNREVNGYFICDRGRYGYEFVNSDRRIREPLLRDRAGATKNEILDVAARLLKTGRTIGIGSPRASLETNFALWSLVGDENFYHGVGERDVQLARKIVDVLRNGPVAAASMHDVEMADAVLILGEDLSNAAPMLDLAVRQAVLRKPKTEASSMDIPYWHDAAVREVVQDNRGPLFIATPNKTNLDRESAIAYRAAPDDIARLGFAVAHVLDPLAPDMPTASDDLRSRADRIAKSLKESARPVVIAGMSCRNKSIIESAINIAIALKPFRPETRLCFVVPECNSMGLAMMPGWGGIESAFNEVVEGRADTVVIAESDIHRYLDSKSANRLFKAAKRVIAIDQLANATTVNAGVVLPAAAFAEASGTLINNEGRAQRFVQVFAPKGHIQSSWRWLGELKVLRDGSPSSPWRNLDELLSELELAWPPFAGISRITPPATFRRVGKGIPRQPHRYSGRTAMHAHEDVHEQKPPENSDTPLTFSMEGYDGPPPASLAPRYWSPGWNSVQALIKFQSEKDGLFGYSADGLLLTKERAETLAYSANIPPAFTPKRGEWLAVPAYHIFGSEELSALSPGIAEFAPAPYVALCLEDAQSHGLQDKQDVWMKLGQASFKVAMRIQSTIPRGVAVVPAGLAELPGLSLPDWIAISSASETSPGGGGGGI